VVYNVGCWCWMLVLVCSCDEHWVEMKCLGSMIFTVVGCYCGGKEEGFEWLFWVVGDGGWR
jgi:hypothetical protein